MSSNSSEVQHIPGKGILINNYGHLSFTDYPQEQRPSNLRRLNVGNKVKQQPHAHGRYVAELNTKRTNKEIATSREF